MEDDEAFEAVHAMIARLYAEGLIDGVRVDHIDGLADPAGYCHKLRQRLDPSNPARPYLVVEKILLRGETLPARLGLRRHHRLRLHGRGERAAARPGRRAGAGRGVGQRSAAGRPISRPRRQAARREIIARSFSAPARSLRRAPSTGWSRATSAGRRCAARSPRCWCISRSIAATASRPTCRGSKQAAKAAKRPGSPSDRLGDRLAAMRRHAGAAPRHHALPAAERAGRRQVGRGHGLLSLRPAALAQRRRLRHRALRLARRRTSMPACSAGKRRSRTAMLATATHDHKRGEDVRARLAVLSENAAGMDRSGWRAGSTRPRSSAPTACPVKADIAMLLQTIVGAWPLDLDARGRASAAPPSPSGSPAGSRRRCARPSS